MEIHNKNYKEKQENKLEYYQDKAEKNHAKSEQEFEHAREMADVIPFGQPILIGHHSESRDRRYRAKIERKFEKSFETLNKAEYYDDKVKAVEHNNTISQDDPEAVKLLKEKIADLEKEYARIKALPKKPRDYSFSEIDMRSCHMSSISTKIRAAKKRIEKIKVLEALPDIDEEINKIRIYTDEGRIRIDFGYKPEEETRTKLKRACFKWSPYNEVWQNYINQWNIDKARQIAKEEKN